MSNISVSLPSDGDTIDVSDYNTPINTIVTDYNGNIDNSNLAAAAAIAGTKIADSAITPLKWTNPYKFRAHPASNQTGITSGSDATVTLGTEDYDTNSNFASNLYTAPVTGYYHFSGTLYVIPSSAGTLTGGSVYLYKNGATNVSAGSGWYDNNVSADFMSFSVSDTILLTASDTIALRGNGLASTGTVTFTTASFLSGYLVSQT